MLIVWDYFGVIAQTPFWDQVEQLAQKSGESDVLYAKRKLSDDGKIAWEEYCSYVSSITGVGVDDVMNRHRHHDINPDAIHTIRALPQHRHVVLSNASHTHLLPVMHELGLDTLFEAIYVSSQIGASKPSPRAFLTVLDSSDVEAANALMIDDSPHNIDSAKGLGMHGIVYVPEVHLQEAIQSIYSV